MVIVEDDQLTNICPWCNRPYSEHPGGPNYKQENEEEMEKL